MKVKKMKWGKNERKEDEMGGKNSATVRGPSRNDFDTIPAGKILDR